MKKEEKINKIIDGIKIMLENANDEDINNLYEDLKVMIAVYFAKK